MIPASILSDKGPDIVTDAEPMQTTSSSQENIADASAEIAQGVIVEADTESNENPMQTPTSNSDGEHAPTPYDEAMLHLLNHISIVVDPPPMIVRVNKLRSSRVPSSRDKDHEPKLKLSQK